MGKVLADSAVQILYEKGAEAIHQIANKAYSKIKKKLRDHAIGVSVKIGTVFSVKHESYTFQSLKTPFIFYFFKTEDRKRLFQVRRVIENTLPSSYLNDYLLQRATKKFFYENLRYLKLSDSWKLFHESLHFMGYDGSDLKVFEDPNSFYPWQTQIANLIFDKSGTIREADDRKIIAVIDKKGNKRKSFFIKYLCWDGLDSIVKVGYGLSHQLRSSVIRASPKEVYIIDLPRTRKRNDNMDDMLFVIEKVKNQFLTSPMYGKNKNFMMRPSFVLVFSNTHLPYDKLSKDRWECYEMTESEKPKLKLISVR